MGKLFIAAIALLLAICFVHALPLGNDAKSLVSILLFLIAIARFAVIVNGLAKKYPVTEE